MNMTSTEQAKTGVQVTQTILQTNPEFRATDNNWQATSSERLSSVRDT
jgi:hypothetical protein